MQLPSPIPHPLDFLDAPGWMREALEWVIGVDWPEGNEKLVWDTADLWFQAAQSLVHPHDSATAAATEIVAGWGGPDTAVAAAFSAAWNDVGGNDEAALAVLSSLAHGVGKMTESCGCDIQAAKIETYVELGLLLIELVSLGIAACFTFGAASAAAGPAMMATRMAIQQILKRLIVKLLRKALKEGAEQAIERAAKVATKRGVRIAARTGRHMLEEGLEELAVDYGTQNYQIGRGRRDGYDTTSLLTSFGGGAAGGGLAGLAGLGPSARSSLGHLTENLGRGAAGEVLAETGASLVTGQGLPDADNLARSATSGMVSGGIHHGHHSLDHTLDARAAALNGDFGAGHGTPDLSAVGGPPTDDLSVAATFGQSGIDRGGPPATTHGSDHPVDTAGHPPAVGPQPTSHQTTAMPEPTGVPPWMMQQTGGHDVPSIPLSALAALAGADPGPPSVQPVVEQAAPAPVPEHVAAHGDPQIELAGLSPLGLGDPTSGATPAVVHQAQPPAQPPGPGWGATGNVATPGWGASTNVAASSWETPTSGAPVSADASLRSARTVGWSAPPSTTPAPRVSSPTVSPTPANPSSATAAPVASRPTTSTATDTSPQGRPDAASSGWSSSVSTARPASDDSGTAVGRATPRVSPSSTPPATPRPSSPASDPVLSRQIGDEADATWSRERSRARWHEYEADRSRQEREARDRQLEEAYHRHDRLERQQHQTWTGAQTEHGGGLGSQAAEQQRREIHRIEGEGRRPDLIHVSEDAHGFLNSEVLPTATGGVTSSNRSLLTGDDNPRPVEASRSYGQRGGHRVPLAYDQLALEQAMPRDEHGDVVRWADVDQPWFQLANDGGVEADPTRGLNCVDTVLSFCDTWAHGRPRVAAPRTFDAYAEADPNRPAGGEHGGLLRAQRTLGADFTTVYTEAAATYDTPEAIYSERMTEISRALEIAGPGSFAMIVNTWGLGGAHAWAAINQDGRIRFVDPQNGFVYHEPLYRTLGYHGGVNRVDVIVLDPNGQPLHLSPDDLRQPLRPWEAGEPTGAGTDPLPGPADPELGGAQAVSPAQATALAVECRTHDGLVDPVALARFVENVRSLDAEGPGGAVGALRSFAASALGIEGARIVPVSGGTGKGQSGAPVYLVRDESGDVIAVAKIFPAVEELVRELSALDRLGAAEFSHFTAPQARGVAVMDLPNGTAGALVMSLAPGRSLFDMISELPAYGSPDRPTTMIELRQAVQEAAVALAELHSLPVGSGGPVDPGFLKFNHGLAQRETAAVAAYGDVLAEMGVNVEELSQRVDEAVQAALADPGRSSVMHGDAHPGNVFWDPTHGVTLIDTPHCHFSIDDSGMPIGSPARDVSNMVERLAHFSREAGFEWSEGSDLQSAFIDAYVHGGGPAITDAAFTAFAARFAVRDVLDTLTAMDEGGWSGETSEMLRGQLADEIELMRRALRWEL